MSDNVFPKKYAEVIKKLPEFKDIADAASKEELKQMILTANSNMYVVEKEKDNDPKLQAAKEKVKDFSEPYRDALKVLQAKVKYCLFCLEGKGEDLDKREDEDSSS